VSARAKNLGHGSNVSRGSHPLEFRDFHFALIAVNKALTGGNALRGGGQRKEESGGARRSMVEGANSYLNGGWDEMRDLRVATPV